MKLFYANCSEAFKPALLSLIETYAKLSTKAIYMLLYKTHCLHAMLNNIKKCTDNW